MAAEFVCSAAANTIGNLATEYASPCLSYFFRFGKIVEDFKNQRKDLELENNKLNRRVDEAKSQTEVIEPDVQEWLKEAEKQLQDAQRLEAEIEHQKCFNWCPSWGWRYCLSVKVAKKTPYIAKLIQRCNFQRVGIRPSLQGLEFFPFKGFKSSKSSNLAFNGIMRALNTNGVNMIGLYGMPGVGKTTLAKEVRRQAEEQKLFDNVVMVTMSQTPNINDIQEKIAKSLDFKFEASFGEGKTEELGRKLKVMKKILLIFDDVWKEFELLKTVGIPFGDEHEGCKILLTTRLQEICDQMNCKENFELKILSKDEAWALFKENAGLDNVSLPLSDVAKEVASECKGLPLAIVIIGKTLKGARLEKWKTVNRRFKDSRHLDNEEVCEDIYKSLLVSYDFLKGDNIRSCLLLCSLFPEDYHINIELLIMFGIGYGVFSHIYSMEDLRGEICEALRKLQGSGLLLKTDDGDDENYVSMHDVVRDFCHWKTLRGENIFKVKEGLTEWPMKESFGCCTAISFWNSNINNFSEKLKFSKLKILVFNGQNTVRVPSTFFETMEALQVLYLQNVTLSLEVLEFVRNLRTLCFIHCQLENISSLKNLANLEILTFLDTDIYELHKELLALSRLKSLHFSYHGDQQVNFPPNLLARLTSLQELHLTCPNNANLSELNSLSGLTALSLRVSTAQCFRGNFVFPMLQRYMIAVSEDYLECLQGLKFRTLKIKDFSFSLSAFKKLFCNVQKLYLENAAKEHKNIVPSVDLEGLNELTSLELKLCCDLECLMDTTGENGPTSAIFCNLEKLKMEDMYCLKELCHGQPPIRFLQKLTDVSIVNCEHLKVVFQMNEILEMEEISQILLLSNLTSLVLHSLPELESIWKLQSTHQSHASHQGLKFVRIKHCNKLKSVFSTCIAQSLLHLQQLDISYCHKLEGIFDFPQEMVELEVPPLSNLIYLELNMLPALKWIWKGPTHLVKLQSLKAMTIEGCMNLAYLFPIPLAQSLVHLEVLQIKSCDSLEYVFLEEIENEDEIVSHVLQHCDPLCCPKLRTLEITDCGELKYVFPISLAQGLSSLESVEITDCAQLKHVFNMTEENGSCSNNFVMSLSLKEFKVRNCPRLTRFRNLQGVALQANSNFEDAPSYGFKELCNAKNVTMGGTMYHSNLIPNVDPEGLNEVTFLTLKHGEELECLIDTTYQSHVSTIVFFNLVELVIENMTGFKKLCKGPFPKGFLQKLEKLEARHCMELVSLSPALQNLKEARVINCGQLQEVFQTEDPVHDMKENEARLLSKLTSLELGSLPELKWIWKGPSHYVSLQSLKVTEISRCNRLKYLFSPSLAQSLVLLEQLKIEDCDELEYVFQIPLAQGLSHLKSLSITNAPELKEVFNVAKEKNGIDHSVALPRLQHLRLENLIKLSCLCSENYPIVSSSLEKLIIVVCPLLANFTIEQDVNKQLQLKELWLSKLGHDNVCDTSFYQKIFQNKNGHFLSRIETLSLKLIHQLQGPIKVGSFQNFRALRVSKCNGLKSLFSSMVARNLPQLKLLHIKCCEKLEEIIEMDQTSIASSSQGHLQPISFPSLEFVGIYGCRNLKSLFPISVIHSLSELKYMEIFEVSNLEQLFYQGHEQDLEDDQKEIEFPKLGGFKLSELPRLKSFVPMGYHFRVPSLGYFEVTGCPRLMEKFNPDSKHLVHGITEVNQLSQEVQKNTSESSTSMEEITGNKSAFTWCGEDVKDEILGYVHRGKTSIMFHKDVNFLNIKRCGELGAIEKSQAWMFPLSWNMISIIHGHTLKRIWMYGCYNLKFLFSIYVAPSLSNLQSIKIYGASKLEQVFGYKGSPDVEDDQKGILLPALKELKLSELPSLNNFAPAGYHAQLPSLSYFKVTKCPKLITNFSLSKLPAHAITKESQQAQNDMAKDFNTVKEIINNQSSCNDINWRRPDVEDPIPRYMTMGVTRIMLHNEVKK